MAKMTGEASNKRTSVLGETGLDGMLFLVEMK
jgi:hypothetical protein